MFPRPAAFPCTIAQRPAPVWPTCGSIRVFWHFIISSSAAFHDFKIILRADLSAFEDPFHSHPSASPRACARRGIRARRASKGAIISSEYPMPRGKTGGVAPAIQMRRAGFSSTAQHRSRGRAENTGGVFLTLQESVWHAAWCCAWTITLQPATAKATWGGSIGGAIDFMPGGLFAASFATFKTTSEKPCFNAHAICPASPPGNCRNQSISPGSNRRKRANWMCWKSEPPYVGCYRESGAKAASISEDPTENNGLQAARVRIH